MGQIENEAGERKGSGEGEGRKK